MAKKSVINNNYNNDNNDNNYNDITTLLIAEDNQNKNLATPPLGETSSQGVTPQEEGGSCSSPKPKWERVKIDLFLNGDDLVRGNDLQYRLKLNFTAQGKEAISLSALLNSQWKDAKRGFDWRSPEELAHYNLFEQTYREFKNDEALVDVRASKCYISNGRGQKGQTVYGSSVVVGFTAQVGTYIVAFIIDTDIEYMTITQAATSDKQRKSACIATGNMSSGLVKPRLTATKLFGA